MTSPRRLRRPADDRQGPHHDSVDAAALDCHREGRHPLPRLPRSRTGRRSVVEDPDNRTPELGSEFPKVSFLIRRRVRNPDRIPDVDRQSSHFPEEPQDRRNVNQIRPDLTGETWIMVIRAVLYACPRLLKRIQARSDDPAPSRPMLPQWTDFEEGYSIFVEEFPN